MDYNSAITKSIAKVGPVIAAQGSEVQHRSDKTGSLVVTPGHGTYQEAVLGGNVYGVCNQAGVTSQAGLSATTPVLTLYNPAGSGVNAVLWFAGATFSVAFATAGAIWLAVNTNVAAAAVTGTLTTAHRNMLLGGANSPKVIPMLAATLPAAPVGLSILGVGLTGAITTTPMAQTVGKCFDGSVVLAPGTAVSIQTGVASGASGMFCEFIWEEVAI
jgi:hypothetical protein